MAKILLVEDDNNLREIFEMRMQAEGYQTIVASDGEEALVIAMREKPDLIVADVMMPKLSGFEMLENLRAAPELADTKVIMMTALGQAEDQARGEKLGVVKYLVKSQVTLEDFARVVRDVLQPGSSSEKASPAPGATDNVDDKSANNSKESEKSMPEDNTTPTNPLNPTPPADSGGTDNNPLSGVPSDDSSASGAQSTAQEQNSVNSQVNDFVSGGGSAAPGSDDSTAAGAPAADSSAPAAGGSQDNSFGSSTPTEHTDIPVAEPSASDPAASSPSSDSTEDENNKPEAPLGAPGSTL